MTDLSQYLGGAFDANDVPTDEFDLINPGSYTAVITETEIKDGGDKVGFIIKCQIMGSQYDGRVLSDYLNIKHPNEKAVKISKRRLADYALATGNPTIAEQSVLHNQRVSIEVDVQQPKPGDTYMDKFGVEKQSQAQNRIKKVMALNSNTGAVSGPVQSAPVEPQGQSSPTQEAPAGSPPWAK